MSVTGNFLAGYTANKDGRKHWFSQRYELLDWIRREARA